MSSTFVNKLKLKDTILEDTTNIFSFQSYLDLVGLPLIIFEQNGKKYKFIFDTGCETSHINIKSDIDMGILEGYSANSVAANGTVTQCSYAGVIMNHKGKEFKHIFRASDLSKLVDNIKKNTGVSIEGLIGVDFMDKYNYCIDFKDYIIYERK